MASKASRLGRATQHIQHDTGTVMYGLKRYGCSAFSAALAESITFPCDTVKVHQQLQGRTGGGASAKHTSIVNTVRNIVKSEGPIGIYRGVIPAVLRQVTYGGIHASCYQPVKVLISGDQQPPFYKKVLAGGLVSGIGQYIATPFDVAKIRLQTDLATGTMRYNGMFDVMKSIGGSDGLRALFAGWGPAVKRVAVVNGTWIATYDEAKETVYRLTPLRGIPAYALASQISGFVSSVVGCPIDVIKTRLMSQSADEKYYRNALDCVGKVLRHEGPLALYKGFIPTLVRTGPWSLVFFVVFEQVSMAVFGHSLV